MDLFHYKTHSGNFGDDLNLWLWDAILPGWRDMRPDTILVGVGTLINSRLPRGQRKLVLGSGVGYGDLPDAALMAKCEFLAVRGPLSAAALDLPGDRSAADPAILIPDLPAFQNIEKTGSALFIPHHNSVHRADWATLCARAGIAYVSPERGANDVIHLIAAAPLIIAESMHAAIIADAFGTPWHAVSISHKFNDWKWQDWAGSLGMELSIPSLFPLSQKIAKFLPEKITTSAKSTASAPAPYRVPIRHRLRLRLETMQAESRFRSLVTSPGTLSDRAVLARAKERYRTVLERVSEAAEA